MSHEYLQLPVASFKTVKTTIPDRNAPAWHRIVGKLLKHQPTDDKFSAPLFSFVQYAEEQDWTGWEVVRTENYPDGRLKSITRTKHGVIRTSSPDGRIIRHNDNIVTVSALVLDFDEGGTIEQVHDYLNGIEHLIYTSHSHDPDAGAIKFRAVIPFEAPIKPEEYRKLWQVVSDSLPCTPDKQCKDPARAFFFPTAPAERIANAVAIHGVGDLFKPFEAMELASKSANDNDLLDAPAGQAPLTAPLTAPPIPQPMHRERDPREEYQLAEDALKHLDPDMEYGDWLRVGMAIQSAFADDGLWLWDAWSANGTKYEGQAMTQKHWRSFHGDGVKIGTLFAMAKERGWQRPRRHRAPVGAPQQMPQQNTDPGQEAPQSGPIPASDSLGMYGGEPLNIFGGFKPKAVPIDAFPAAFQTYIADQAALQGSDGTYIGMTCLVSAASVLHDGIKIQPKRHDPTWTESARIWVALVGNPSTMKSPSIKAGIRHVKRIDAMLSEKSEKEIGSWKREVEANKELRRVAKKQGEPDLVKDPPEPPNERAMVTDITVEALSEIMKYNPRGILSYRDELAGWFGGMDAYKGGSKASSIDRSNWLEAYNGGSRLIDRVTRGSVRVPNWSVCILGSIQPQVIKELASNIGHDGLLQRFCIVWGDDVDKEKDRMPDMQAMEHYKEMFDKLFALAPCENPVRLSEAAHVVRERVADLSRKLMKVIDSPHIQAWLGKWTGLFARMVLLYHVIECADHRIYPTTVPVSEATALQVEKLITVHLLHHAVFFYVDIMDANARNDHARQLARAILARKLNRFTRRDILHSWKKARSLQDFELHEVLGILINSAWIAPDMGSLGPNGKPTVWFVNPRIHELFAKIAEDETVRRAAARRELQERLREMMG